MEQPEFSTKPCPACGHLRRISKRWVVCRPCFLLLPPEFQKRLRPDADQTLIDMAIALLSQIRSQRAIYTSCRACGDEYAAPSERPLCGGCFFRLPVEAQHVLRHDKPEKLDAAIFFLRQPRRKKCIACRSKKKQRMPPFCGGCIAKLPREICDALQWGVGSRDHDQTVARAVELLAGCLVKV